jgi:prepilin-type N-terminal cleavage/methylation domain-containing protein
MPHPSPRRGFTLIELMIVLTIIGIATAVAMPRISLALGAARSRAAKNHVISMVGTARSTAVQRGRTARLRLENGKMWVVSNPTAATPVLVTDTTDFSKKYSVTMTPTSLAVDFGARGLATTGGSGTQFILTNETRRRDTLCLSSLGVVLRRGC